MTQPPSSPHSSAATPSSVRSIPLRLWLPSMMVGIGIALFALILLLQRTAAWADPLLQMLILLGISLLGGVIGMAMVQRFVLRPIAHLQRSLPHYQTPSAHPLPPPHLHGQGELLELELSLRRMAQHLHDGRTELAANAARFKRLASASQEAIFLAEGGVIIDANQAAEKLLQTEPGGLIGSTILQWAAPEFHHVISQRITHGLEGSWAVDVVTAKGKTISCESQVHEVVLDGKTLRVLSVRDISERLQAEATIRQLVHFDALTGLPNRRLLLDLLTTELKNTFPGHKRAALATLNLNNFKSINDSLGMHTGDAVLSQLAQRLAGQLETGQTLARVDGDTMALLITGLEGSIETCSNQAATVVEQLLSTITHPLQIGGQQLHLSAAAGITLLSGEHQEPAEILRQAETAMHQAKQSSQQSLCFFAASLQQAASQRLALRNDLRQALLAPHTQFQLYYQPQVDGRGKLYGVEALIRWQHPQKGLIAPNHFIPEAESSDLILPLGQWVLTEACSALVRWRQQAHSAPWAQSMGIAVNVSAKQFLQANFVQQVLTTLEQENLDPEALTLELTESVLIQDLEATLQKMAWLRQHGVRIALDDFGTGYSSLSYLKRLPLDTLKIDRSFIRDIDDNSATRLGGKHPAVLIESIIQMAHQLDIEVLAEGVETKAQMQYLQQAQCDLFQGYYLSRPLPEADLHPWASQQHQATA